MIFSVSGYSTTLYAYIGEFNCKRHRDIILSWMTVSIGIANIFIPLSAMILLSFEWQIDLSFLLFRPWRLLMIIFTSPGIIAAIWMTQLPESPRFLIARGQHSDANEILKWMNKKNGGNAENELKAQTLENSDEARPSIFRSFLLQTFPLFQIKNFTPLALCSVLHFGTFSISNGVGVFVPEFLKAIASSSDPSEGLCSFVDFNNNIVVLNSTCDDSIDPNVFIDTFYLGLFYTIAFIFLAMVLKFVDRRHVLTINLMTSAIGGIAMIYLTEKWMIIASCFIFVAQSGVNISLINSILCETIPPKYLTMAICLAMTFGRLGSVLTSNLIGVFIESECVIIFNSFAGLVFICFLLSFFKVT